MASGSSQHRGLLVARNTLKPWTDGAVRHSRSLAVLALAGVSLAACATPQGPTPVAQATHRPHGPGSSSGQLPGTMRPYQVNGTWYTPRDQPDYEAVGVASWYGAQFHNHRTADGEIFDMDAPSGAHKTLPLPCIVEVTNLENGRKLRVRINDRGPFVDGRVIDLSREAAKQLGFYAKGTAKVRVRYVGPADLARPEDGLRYASAEPPPRSRPQPLPPPSRTYATANDDSQALTAQPAEHPAAPAYSAPTRTVRIQAAAFSDRSNAEQAAARLAAQGQTSIDTIQRGDSVLYRVTVRCNGEDDAVGRVAAAGFPGARLLDGF
jgi:rare lipoprotein A